MLLSDSKIKRLVGTRDLGIEPFDERQLQPASYDMRLGSQFRVPRSDIGHIDVSDVPEGHTELIEVSEEGMTLAPGEFIIGTTEEVVRIGHGLAGRVEGKSSLGRLGLTIHVTAGFIDPGFEGHITLEMFNAAPWKITMHPGMRIAQLALQVIDGPVHRPYGSAGNSYQGQRGPTESKFRMEKRDG